MRVCEPSPEDQGWHRQEQRTKGRLGKGAEHCSQGLELYRALLRSIQSGKVQIGLEVICSCPPPPARCALTQPHGDEQQSRCCDLREAGSLCCPQAVVPLGSPWSPHTQGSREAGAVSAEGGALCCLLTSGTLRGLLLTPPCKGWGESPSWLVALTKWF